VIKLRLRRMGAKKQPSYRIVAAESSKPRDGRFIEIVGHYDPKTDPYTLKVNEERAKYWLDNGAQPTETVRSLLVKCGVLPGYQGGAAGQQPAKAAAKPTEDAPAAEEASAEAESSEN
jgi:small subunit ribosomal protein S16